MPTKPTFQYATAGTHMTIITHLRVINRNLQYMLVILQEIEKWRIGPGKTLVENICICIAMGVLNIRCRK